MRGEEERPPTAVGGPKGDRGGRRAEALLSCKTGVHLRPPLIRNRGSPLFHNFFLGFTMRSWQLPSSGLSHPQISRHGLTGHQRRCGDGAVEQPIRLSPSLSFPPSTLIELNKISNGLQQLPEALSFPPSPSLPLFLIPPFETAAVPFCMLEPDRYDSVQPVQFETVQRTVH